MRKRLMWTLILKRRLTATGPEKSRCRHSQGWLPQRQGPSGMRQKQAHRGGHSSGRKVLSRLDRRKGHTTVRVAFPESTPFSAEGQVTAFNGGVVGGVTTLFIHAFVAVPSPTAGVTTVKIKRVDNGPYGLRSIATIPAIAGGNGSLTKFDLTIHRLFNYRGRQQSYLEGECHNDKQLAKVLDIFADGTQISGSLVRPCKVRK